MPTPPTRPWDPADHLATVLKVVAALGLRLQAVPVPGSATRN